MQRVGFCSRWRCEIIGVCTALTCELFVYRLSANQWTLERDSGHAEKVTWYCIAFLCKQISRAAWNSLEHLAWLPVVSPEGSSRYSVGAISYLSVPRGLVLLSILGHSRCLVTLQFVMWFMKKWAHSLYDPKNLFQSKKNRTTGAGPVRSHASANSANCSVWLI